MIKKRKLKLEEIACIMRRRLKLKLLTFSYVYGVLYSMQLLMSHNRSVYLQLFEFHTTFHVVRLRDVVQLFVYPTGE